MKFIIPPPLLDFGGAAHSTTILKVLCMYEQRIFEFDVQTFQLPNTSGKYGKNLNRLNHDLVCLLLTKHK